MGTTLDHGIYLPDEGERNCYDGLAGNWVALDNHLGNTDIHVTINDKQAWDGHVADTTIHVTSADKQAWNGHVADTTIHVTSADKQAWDGHVADTTIHVTSADKQAWNGHIADTVKHVTAEDKAKWDAVTSKADDSAVVHKSGNETVSGNKTFSSNVNVYNSDSSASTPNFTLRSSKSAMGTSNTDDQGIFWNDKNNDTLASLRIQNYTLNGSTYLTQTVNTKDTNNQNISASLSFYILNNGRKVFRPNIDNDVLLGYSSNKWKDFYTYLINGLEPSALSLPSNNSSNVVDISSYITHFDGTLNRYVPPANGWIGIYVNNCTELYMKIDNLWGKNVCRSDAGKLVLLMPVPKGKGVDIQIFATGTLRYARFVPCSGNV